MDILKKLTEELGIQRWQTEAAVKLIDEGNTIPFISRYRKEATGSLNDEVLRNLNERLSYLRNLEEKKEQVLGSIREQGKLTEELEQQILAYLFWRQRPWLWWTICTAPTAPNAAPAPPSPRKRAWRDWPM